MSLEAWGDEGDTGPEGYVTEERADEMVKEATQDLERQVAESVAMYAQVILGQRTLRQALQQAVEVIKTWHNMPTPVKVDERLQKYIEHTWRIYYDNAPEMRAIREALK